MLSDQLVQFAASKVGGKAIATDAGPMISIPNHGLHFLSGADLMLKGMEVLEQEKKGIALYWIADHGYMTINSVPGDRGSGKQVRLSSIADLPLTFWTCCYRLEKGE